MPFIPKADAFSKISDIVASPTGMGVAQHLLSGRQSKMMRKSPLLFATQKNVAIHPIIVLASISYTIPIAFTAMKQANMLPRISRGVSCLNFPHLP